MTATSPQTLAIVQARMSSSRLPGKVLMPLGGLPLILFMLARVRRARLVDDIVLATSTDASDDELAQVVQAAGYRVHRGPLDDVLARFAGAAAASPARVLVRLTGDCPLIDPAIVDRVVQRVASGDCDYCTNGDPATYPDGLDVEAFTHAALREAHEQARLPSEREHVTPWLRAHPERVRVASVRGAVDLSALRWTVDHADDLALVRALVDGLGAERALQADLFDFLRLVDARPELVSPNVHTRNEGYLKSLQADVAVPVGGA